MGTLCERCRKEWDSWRVARVHLAVGRLDARPNLCVDCAADVPEPVFVQSESERRTLMRSRGLREALYTRKTIEKPF